ncbi:MAG: phosphoglycerate dehydrogenase [Desulfobacterales bacterium]|nr:phosphoglycerate dehydrogenase [Desulfobacterales bacterium]
MKWRILVSAPYFLPVIEDYQQKLASEGIELVAATVNERLEEDELLELMGDFDGIICGDDRITARVLDASPRLKVISKWGTGIDSIDSKEAAKRGILVCRTPNAFSEPVADTVMGYILQFARNLSRMDREIRQGVWAKPLSRSLNECCLGVVGVGDCGKAVIRRARAFGMQIIGNDIRAISSDFIAEYSVEMVALKTLLEQADFISLNTDLNPHSYHLISDAQFGLMKTSACLINTSRGPVVDEPALVRALNTKAIAGAALDVFEDEPLPLDSPLRQFQNCYFAPHNANSSPMAWQRVHESTVRNLLDGLKQAR